MRAFELSVNGKPLCVAGVGKNGYVSAYITYRSDPDATWIDVVGLVSRKKVYVRWKQKDLRPGDQVTLRVVDRRTVDKYRITRRNDWKEDIEATKKLARTLAKRFGWKIQDNARNRSVKSR